jgi:hypothetical protein
MGMAALRQLVSNKMERGKLGGFGSGRSSDRPIVEQALRLDVDQLMRSGVIRPGEHLAGEIRLQFDDDDLVVKFESRCDPWDTWLRLRYSIPDYETPGQHNALARIESGACAECGSPASRGSHPHRGA